MKNSLKWLLIFTLLTLTFFLTSCNWFNQAPVAQISVSTTNGEAPLTVSFDGTGSYDSDGSIRDYNWNFGDGNYHYGISTSHTYQNEGTYTATLTVTDRGGLTDHDSVSITVNPQQGQDQPPVADFAYSPSNPVAGETIAFTDQSNDPDGSIVTCDWNFGDGTSASGLVVSHVYNSQGTYDVTLTATDDDGLSDTKTKSVSVQSGQEPPTNQSPVADFSYSPSSPEVGETVNFDASSSSDSDGYIESYDWDFGDGYTGSGVSVTHSYTSQGAYDVTLTITDNDEAEDIKTKALSIQKQAAEPPSNNEIQEAAEPFLDVDMPFYKDCSITTLDPTFAGNAVLWDRVVDDQGNQWDVWLTVKHLYGDADCDYAIDGETGVPPYGVTDKFAVFYTPPTGWVPLTNRGFPAVNWNDLAIGQLLIEVGYYKQANKFHPHMPVGEIIDFNGKLRGDDVAFKAYSEHGYSGSLVLRYTDQNQDGQATTSELHYAGLANSIRYDEKVAEQVTWVTYGLPNWGSLTWISPSGGARWSEHAKKLIIQQLKEGNDKLK